MSELMVTKVTLTTKKIVYLKEPTVDDMEAAGQVAGQISKGNDTQMGMALQKELLKRVLVQVNDKKLGLAEKEGINKMFSLKEYTQVMKVIKDLSGMDEDEGKLVTEVVTFGSN